MSHETSPTCHIGVFLLINFRGQSFESVIVFFSGFKASQKHIFLQSRLKCLHGIATAESLLHQFFLHRGHGLSLFIEKGNQALHGEFSNRILLVPVSQVHLPVFFFNFPNHSHIVVLSQLRVSHFFVNGSFTQVHLTLDLKRRTSELNPSSRSRL